MSDDEHRALLTDEWKKRLQLAAALLVGLIPVGSGLIVELGLDAVPFFAAALAVGAAVQRALAVPAVMTFIVNYVPWLTPPGSHRR